ncbi:MAG: hypothetical protein ACR2HX_12570 [Pyrinomonadaceae bacterium]
MEVIEAGSGLLDLGQLLDVVPPWNRRQQFSRNLRENFAPVVWRNVQLHFSRSLRGKFVSGVSGEKLPHPPKVGSGLRPSFRSLGSKQTHEPFLRKMPVSSKRFRDAVPTHENEAHGVAE